MKRPLFYDAVLEVEFRKQGYVVIDLLPVKETMKFLQLYNEVEGAKGTANTNQNTYELSFFEKDIDAKKHKFNRIYDFMKPYLGTLLVQYKPIIINLFNKHHGTGEVPMHQNWTFVDEKEFTSVSVWCPMQPVNRQNGTLEIMPGSHKVISDYRGPSIPWVFDNLIGIIKEKYMVPLELNFGQVAVIDDSIIHFSGVNNNSQERKAVQLILKPEEATTIHCFKNDEESNEIKIMDVLDDFFFDFNMWEIPKEGKNLRTIDYPIIKLSEPELLKKTSINLLQHDRH